MRPLGLIVAIVVAIVDVLYVWYIGFVQVGTSDEPWRVPFVAAYLGVVALCALLSTIVPAGAWRVALLGASSSGLLVLGFLALFSIGLPLVIMGLLMGAVLVRTIKSANRGGFSAGTSVVGALTALLVLLAGLWITERIIACPPGAVSGSGTGFLSGSYSYTCQNGRATVTYGHS
jgi:hypothetical protein